jgi:anaphase-promoting complex subunit 6
LYLLKAKILEAMDKRTLAVDCYIMALQKSVYLTEALDSLMQHEMLMAWEEKDLIQHIMPLPQQANDADLKILKHLYESKLKKYYSSQSSHPEKTPNNGNIINTINEKIRNSGLLDSRKSIGLSTSTTIKGQITVKGFGSPSPMAVMSPANKILYDLKNNSSFSIQSSLSRISMLNSSRTVNTSKITSASTIKNAGTLMSSSRALQMLDNSVDVMASRAEELFYNCEYKRCIKVVEG